MRPELWIGLKRNKESLFCTKLYLYEVPLGHRSAARAAVIAADRSIP